MECNKDEALRAKELAEKLFGGARILAMKARDLYPNLDGLPQMLATIDGVPGGKAYVPANQNGFFNLNTANWKDRGHRSAGHPNLTSGSPLSLKRTFWTMCSSCRTQFEYELMKQHNFNPTRMERNYHVSGRTPMSAVNSSLGSGPFSIPSGISSGLTSASAAAESPGFFRMSSENLKRKHEDSQPVMREGMHFVKTHAVERAVAGSANHASYFGSNSVLKGDGSRKKRRTDEHKVDSDKRDMETEIASQKDTFHTGRVNAAGHYKRKM
ncbi:Chaperone protein DnaJ [Sesbania bispinosa]|nr:Chaperone protein DnaJ [Sesbania bispinosa]